MGISPSHRGVTEQLWIVLLLIPTGLVLIHLGLSPDVRTTLIVDPPLADWILIWVAKVIHGSTDHLAANLLYYGIVAPSGYLIARELDRTRAYWRSVGLILVSTPLLTAATGWLLSQLYPAGVAALIGYGASDIVCAFGGLTTVLTVYATAKWFGRGATVRFLGVLALGVLVTAQYYHDRQDVFVAGLLILGLVLLMLIRRDLNDDGRLALHNRRYQRLLSAFGGLSAGLIVLSLFLPAPSTTYPIAMYAHWGGYLGGSLVTACYLSV